MTMTSRWLLVGSIANGLYFSLDFFASLRTIGLKKEALILTR